MSVGLIKTPTKKAAAEKKWPKAKTKNGGKKVGTNGEIFKSIERALKQEAWKQARALIHEALVFHPQDHWLWMMLSSAYYESREYEKALKAAEHALHLAPNCPLALWHYAGALTMNVREFEALEVYEKLRTMDMDEVAYGEHGEGMKEAMQFLNDVHFHMGSLYHWLSEDAKAKISFGKYLHNRKHGVKSNYKIAEVKKYLADMEREPATKPYSANGKN